MKNFSFDVIVTIVGIVIFLGVVFLFVCDVVNHRSDEQVLCEDPLVLSLGLEIVSRECVAFNRSVTAFLVVKNKRTGKETSYTVNRVSGDVVFNLTTGEAIGIDKAGDASMVAAASMALSASTIARGR